MHLNTILCAQYKFEGLHAMYDLIHCIYKEPVRDAEVGLEELMTHACEHLNCKVMLCEVRQMHRATA